MKTLKLFNAVIAKPSDEDAVFTSSGILITPNALWAKEYILRYIQELKLEGKSLNKTFHKSWEVIQKTSRQQLFVEQIQHYLSTYGSNFEDEIYIPEEVLKIKGMKLTFKVIKGYNFNELQKKCLDMLSSGIALKEETIDDILTCLVNELDYRFTGQEEVRNKEAVIKIADMYNVFPKNMTAPEFMRYLIFKATGETLLIKNKETIEKIKESKFNPTILIERFGMERTSQVFNRFKPLFLAFKGNYPKLINKLSKLSKTNHKPMIENPLNLVTSRAIETHDKRFLDNATPFALFKALSACYSRMKGQTNFVYRVRNGKSWAKEGNRSNFSDLNFYTLLDYLKSRYNFLDKKIYLPKDVKFALPTSEKLFVGNIPVGTRFYGKRLAVGIYWEDNFGANDLDLSAVNIAGKVGWNADYNQRGSGQLMYSGDITSAPYGAVEYLYAGFGLSHPSLVMNNVYSGSHDARYNIIIGEGDKITREYMMNPNNLKAVIETNSVQKNTVLGMLIPKKDKVCFVLLNFGQGHARVSSGGKYSELATKALFEQYNKPFTFNKLLKNLGTEIVERPEEAEVSFALDTLEKDNFINLFI